jgi:hypothetical protein
VKSDYIKTLNNVLLLATYDVFTTKIHLFWPTLVDFSFQQDLTSRSKLNFATSHDHILLHLKHILLHLKAPNNLPETNPDIPSKIKAKKT